MNDRFKFRFYDKQCKMYLPDGYYINGNKWMDDYYEDVYDLPENIIPEQCTGLKDKSGRLIYEGDIIRYCVNWRAYCLTYTRIVAWDKNTAGFIMINGKTQVKPLQKWRFPDPETHIIEIVGNIHEQAEQKDVK